MDGITLDHLVAELRPVLLGRHLGRPKGLSPHAVVLEISGERDRRLWLDAARGTAGLYLLTRGELRSLEVLADPEVPGRLRRALLVLRKYLDGRRVTGLERIAGERTVALTAGSAVLALRISGPSPALTLALDGKPLATVGEGPEAWPLPAPNPGREWDRVDAAVLASAAASAPATGRTVARALLAACPPLGPLLARELDGSAESLAALRARLASPRPTLLSPGPIDRCHDLDLAVPGAVALAPIPLAADAGEAAPSASWAAVAAAFLHARRRGASFERRRRAALAAVRREIRRLDQLATHLAQDLAGLPEAGLLRRRAEALLAAPASLPSGASDADVPDPYTPDARLRFAVEPALDAPANANRLFEKARRIVRGARQIEARLAQTRAALEAVHSSESLVLAALDLGDLAPVVEGDPDLGRPAGREKAVGPRCYLTSRGLSVLVGRGARENHRLTFTVARPEDVWLHARDVPGAHVILRDNEGRASGEDLREAAEVAAFFSEARGEVQADVHVARRKHIRPARGAPGRVQITHSDTLRVTPKDPEGRLRRR